MIKQILIKIRISKKTLRVIRKKSLNVSYGGVPGGL